MARCGECGAEVGEGATLCPECGVVLESATLVRIDSVAPDRVLGRRYVLLSLLGRGGMGAVYLAKDGDLDETVAVKTLPHEFAEDLRALEWMKEEVRLARSLGHENIMRVFNFETDAEKRVSFIVMEFVDGVDLAALAARSPEHRLTLETLLHLLGPTARAIDYAHSKRVIHRDIKPKNIMVDRRGTVKVTDFGIARRMRETMSKISQTVVAGTPMYMAPETLEGDKIDSHADIYSLGVTAYELLSGAPPYSGTGMQLVYQILKKDVPPLEAGVFGGDATLAGRVNGVLLRCMAKKPEDRFPSAVAFYEALAAAAGLDPARARPDDALLQALRKNVTMVVAEQRKAFGPATATVLPTPAARQSPTPGSAPGRVTPAPAASIRAQRDALFTEAAEAEKRGDLAEAISLLKQANEILSSEKVVDRITDLSKRREGYLSHRKAAHEAEEAGDVERALKEYEAALRFNPGSKKLSDRIDALRKRRRAADLEKELRRILSRFETASDEEVERADRLCKELADLGEAAPEQRALADRLVTAPAPDGIFSRRSSRAAQARARRRGPKPRVARRRYATGCDAPGVSAPRTRPRRPATWRRSSRNWKASRIRRVCRTDCGRFTRN